MMDFLPIANKRRTSTKGSNSQAKKTLFSVTNGVGQFFSIVFDHIDYIKCDRVASHPVVVSTIENDDYQYPVAHCTFFSDKYVLFDDEEEEIRQLPEWFGAGFYRAYKDARAFINSDHEALGTRDAETIQIGLDYVVAQDTLE